MTPQQVIEFYGGPNKTRQVAIAARELGVTTAIIYRWIKYGIPYDRQAVIQIESKGKLKATKPKE